MYISSIETRSSPDSLAATLAAFPSISEIPFPGFLISKYLRELRVLRGEIEVVSARPPKPAREPRALPKSVSIACNPWFALF